MMKLDGKNHFLLQKINLIEMIENDELIEWSKVYKDYYGVPKNQIDKPISKNRSVLLRWMFKEPKKSSQKFLR